jgi:hypothetical protein
MPLKQSDVRAVSGLLRELYAHTEAATLPHCVVRLLHRLIPADSAVYNSFDFRTGEMQVVHDHGPEGDRYLPALNEHIEQHPLMVHLRAHWRKGPARTSDVITQRQLRDLAIHSEFLHPLRIRDQLGVLVEARQHAVIAVSLQRDRPGFSGRERQMLSLLQPHFIQAYQNAADFTRGRALNQNSEQALQVAQVGVIRLMPTLKIAWLSNHAAQWLLTYFPLQRERVKDGALPVALENWLRQQGKRSPGAN